MGRQPQSTGRRATPSLNLPNAISALRFPLAALFILVDGGGRIVVVVAAALSDWIDGRLARAQHQVTRAGELLDPIADKTFMVAAIGTLVVEGSLPGWTLPLLLVRDLGVALGAVLLRARGVHVRMPARRPGKAVTWLQFAAIGALLLWPQAAWWIAPAVAAAGMFALLDYAHAVRWTELMR
jgi:CDP-diacylglycerol--glycerol-3-phosphate 3-phosphatidyltransferase/cardiolipin synthase